VDPGLAVGPLLSELTGGSALWTARGEEWLDS
jgi:hypothetical protein